jgi:hypothetical protein
MVYATFGNIFTMYTHVYYFVCSFISLTVDSVAIMSCQETFISKKGRMLPWTLFVLTIVII